MAISRVATSRGAAAQGTTLTPTIPAGTSTGDVHILQVVVQTAAAIAAPSGWRKLHDITDAAPTRYVTFWRLDNGSVGNPLIEWDAGNVFRWWRWTAYTGADLAAPIAVARAQANAASTSCVAPSIMPVEDDDLLVYHGTGNGSNTAAGYTEPAGMTTVDELNNSVFLAEQQLTGGGGTLTGTKTGTLSASIVNSGALLALRQPISGGKFLRGESNSHTVFAAATQAGDDAVVVELDSGSPVMTSALGGKASEVIWFEVTTQGNVAINIDFDSAFYPQYKLVNSSYTVTAEGNNEQGEIDFGVLSEGIYYVVVQDAGSDLYTTLTIDLIPTSGAVLAAPPGEGGGGGSNHAARQLLLGT